MAGPTRTHSFPIRNMRLDPDGGERYGAVPIFERRARWLETGGILLRKIKATDSFSKT